MSAEDLSFVGSHSRPAQNSDKRFGARRRAMMGHGMEAPVTIEEPGPMGEKPETTVWAFESTEGDSKNRALLMYDGVRFFYYDDNILDAYDYHVVSRPNEWHFVRVVVADDGEGTLFIDGEVASTFTTTSRPDSTATGTFMMCADRDAATAAPNSFFYGLVDELTIYGVATSARDMFTASEVTTAGLVALYDARDGTPNMRLTNQKSTIGPTYLSTFADFTMPLAVKSTAPWLPATVMGYGTLRKTGVNGNATVEIMGANFAPSKWLKIAFDRAMTGPLSIFPHELPHPFCGGHVGQHLEATIPYEACYQEHPLHVTNDGIQALIGPGVPFSYHVSMEDLRYELEAFHAFDVKQLGEVERLTEGRDRFIKAAQYFPAYLPESPSKNGTEAAVTVCMWVKLSNEADEIVTIDRTYPGLGAWKMISYVKDGDMELIYVNGYIGNERDTAFWMPMAKMWVDVGVIGIGLDGLGVVDDVYVYSRALRPCEIESRYFTSEYALDFTQHGLVQGNFTLDVDSVTLKAWVRPYSNDEPGTLIATHDDEFTLGLDQDRLVFAVKVGCANTRADGLVVEPCSDFREHVSFRAKVLPNRWSHVAIAYNGIEVMFFVDGVLKDLISWGTHVPMKTPESVLIGQESVKPVGNMTRMLANIDHPYEELHAVKRFNGLMYNVEVSPYRPEAFWVKEHVQCPRRDRGIDNIDFYEAIYGEAGEYSHLSIDTNGMVGVIEGHPSTRPLFANASYDDPTVYEATEIIGVDALNKTSEFPGIFTVTSRTGCLKKRLWGGDGYTIKMAYTDGIDAIPEDTFEATITDTNDGNYHVVYDVPCGAYETTLLNGDGDEVTRWATTVTARHAAAETSTVDSLTVPYCAGSPSVYEIIARDEWGCKSTMVTDGFKMHFDGPMEFEANIVYAGNGMYSALFTPPVAGTYKVNVTLTTGNETKVIVGGEFCMDVCAGGAAQLTCSQYIEVAEYGEMPAVTDIDAAENALTIEAWVKPDSLEANKACDPEVEEGPIQVERRARASDKFHYIAWKNSADGGEFNKGYTFGFDRDMDDLECSVYVGLGQLRHLEGDFNSSLIGVWAHYACVYDGTSMTIYAGGEVLAQHSWDSHMPVHANVYDHPLTIGVGLAGAVDEVRIWATARTEEDFYFNAKCPPGRELNDTIAYFSMSPRDEEDEMIIYGQGRGCNDFAGDYPKCLEGVVVDPNSEYQFGAKDSGSGNGTGSGWTANVVGSPWVLEESFETGVGVPSAERSMVAQKAFGENDIMSSVAAALDLLQFPENVAYEVHARDMCGYKYTTAANDVFFSQATQFSLEYFSDELPGVVPRATPNGFPVETRQAPRQLTPARPVPGFCSAVAADKTNHGPGDIYLGTVATQNSGSHYIVVSTEEETPVYAGVLDVRGSIPSTFEPVAGTNKPVVAGVPAAIQLQVLDAFSNPIAHTEVPFAVTVTNQDDPTYMAEVNAVAFLDGVYTVSFQAGIEGTYTVAFSGEGMSDLSLPMTVFAAPWRPVLTDNMDVPSGVHRFEHTSEVSNDDLYVFGGATSGTRTYLNDVWMMEGADGFASGTQLTYKRTFEVTSTGTDEGSPVVEVFVDTADLITKGKMSERCTDVIFTREDNSGILLYHMDAYYGCNSDRTLFYVKLAEGTLATAMEAKIEMYFGNMEIVDNGYDDPENVLIFHEDFEGGDFEATKLKHSTPCTEDEPPASFVVSDDLAYKSKYSLYAPFAEPGAVISEPIPPTSSFKMRAMFWDSDAVNSAHYVSPDFRDCTLTQLSQKVLIPGADGPLDARSTAVGTYTLSHTTKYMVASPWTSVEAARSAQWKLFEVVSTPSGGMQVLINGEVVKSVEGSITADKVFISAGFGVDTAVHEDLENSRAFWDELMVVPVSDIGIQVAEVGEEEPVLWVEGRSWSKVDTAPSLPPPPRNAHSSVTYDGKMYVFGGERSAYSYNDVWAFDFETHQWSFVKPATPTAPRGRFDHTAVLWGDSMVIYGGNAGRSLLSDMWRFDFKTSTWSEIAPPEGIAAGPRFGHCAAMVAGTNNMLVFGGFSDYSSSTDGFSDDFYSCNLATGSCSGLSARVPEGLEGRFSHQCMSDGRGMYLYGGASLSSKGGYSGVWMYDADKGAWSLMTLMPDAPAEGRYEHTAGLVKGGLYMQGGHENKAYDEKAYFFPVPRGTN